MKENKPFPWREGMIKPLTLEETVCLIFFKNIFFKVIHLFKKKKRKKNIQKNSKDNQKLKKN